MMETGFDKETAMNYLFSLKEELLEQYDISTLKKIKKF